MSENACKGDDPGDETIEVGTHGGIRGRPFLLFVRMNLYQAQPVLAGVEPTAGVQC